MSGFVEGISPLMASTARLLLKVKKIRDLRTFVLVNYC